MKPRFKILFDGKGFIALLKSAGIEAAKSRISEFAKVVPSEP